MYWKDAVVGALPLLIGLFVLLSIFCAFCPSYSSPDAFGSAALIAVVCYLLGVVFAWEPMMTPPRG